MGAAMVTAVVGGGVAPAVGGRVVAVRRGGVGCGEGHN